VEVERGAFRRGCGSRRRRRELSPILKETKVELIDARLRGRKEEGKRTKVGKAEEKTSWLHLVPTSADCVTEEHLRLDVDELGETRRPAREEQDGEVFLRRFFDGLVLRPAWHRLDGSLKVDALRSEIVAWKANLEDAGDGNRRGGGDFFETRAGGRTADKGDGTRRGGTEGEVCRKVWERRIISTGAVVEKGGGESAPFARRREVPGMGMAPIRSRP
jgi:hypothetical protein